MSESQSAAQTAVPSSALHKLILSSESTFAQLLAALREHQELFLSEFFMLLHTAEVARGTKILVLLAAFESESFGLVHALLHDTVNYTLPEILAACRALDSHRRVKSLRAKIADISSRSEVAEHMAAAMDAGEDAGSRKRGRGRNRAEDMPRRVARALAKLNRFTQEVVVRSGEAIEGLTSTLCGRHCELMCQWAYAISATDLSHFLLEFGLEPWREFADLVHLSPAKMALPQFLRFAYNPKDESLLPDNLKFALSLKKLQPRQWMPHLSTIAEYQVPFTFLKKESASAGGVAQWPSALKATVASYTDVTTVLWWIEELRCPEVEDIVTSRVNRGERPQFGYGKLMERLMWCCGAHANLIETLIPIAEGSLRSYALPLRTPMAVLGDCSGSMQVAVRTSSIIVSLIAALGGGDAHLFFFNSKCVTVPILPRTIKEVLVCSQDVRADGSTSPAAALEPLYLNKIPVETLVVVTDEQENDAGPRTNMFFIDLLVRYKAEVAPSVFVVMVSFLGPAEEGQMTKALKGRDIPHMQCRLNGARPDLTKLDQLLGTLSVDTPLHGVAARALAYLLRARGGVDTTSFIADFSRNFISAAASAVLSLLLRAVTVPVANDEQVQTLMAIVRDYFGTFPDGAPGVAEWRDRAASLVGIADVHAWAKEWDSQAFHTIVLQASKGQTAADEAHSQAAASGTLSRISADAMDCCLSYLGPRDLGRAMGSCRRLALCGNELIFDARFREKPAEFADQIEAIRTMGLLGMFPMEEVLEVLRETKGNVEHAIALLFGEGQRGQERMKAKASGRGRAKK